MERKGILGSQVCRFLEECQCRIEKNRARMTHEEANY